MINSKLQPLLLLLLVSASHFVEANLLSSYSYYTQYGSGYGHDTESDDHPQLFDFFPEYHARTAVSTDHTNAFHYAGTGFTGGVGESDLWYGGFRIGGQMRIDDITISYRGIDAVASVADQVKAAVHVIYNVQSTFGSTLYNMQIDFSNTLSGRQSKNIVDESEKGVWETFFNLSVNVPFSLLLSNDLLVGNRWIEDRFRGKANFNNLLGGSPVFNLPDGFFANSADGSIVDNYYVGNDPFVNSAGPTTVAEPTTALIMGLSLVGLGIRRRSKTSSNL